MKVAFISRSTLYSGAGGDTVQMENTARYLRLLGVEVDILLTHEDIDYSRYDLIHFFNIIRPADILNHIRKSSGPYVVSTIYVNYYEFDRYHNGPLKAFLCRYFGKDMVEYSKVIARRFFNNEKINSPAYLFKGHRRSIRSIISNAGCLLPNSHSEYKRLSTDYKIQKRYHVIPNAIDKERFTGHANVKDEEREGLICIGRIEKYKNQLNLIRAVKGTPYKLKIIGKPAPNHRDYYDQCVMEAGENVTFHGQLPQEKLVEYYLTSRVHVLPSWFETTGLSNLEAGALGCRLVITDRGDTTEYFEHYAHYCEPGDVESIRKAIKEAYESAENPQLRDKILSEYNWENAAKKTHEAYLEVLSNLNKEA